MRMPSTILSALPVLSAMAMAAPPQVWAAESATERAATSEAEARGAEMYAYDQAAWRASDRFQVDAQRNEGGLKRLMARGLQGYIVEAGDGGALIVSFYGARDGRRFALARYTTAAPDAAVSGGLVEADGALDLSPIAQRMIDAREKAIAEMRKPNHGLCSKTPPNTLALPPRPDGTIPVYILTSTTSNQTYPVGGHYRFDFDANGVLIGARAFTKSCLDIQYRAPNSTISMAFITHILDRQPTEVHAFISRNISVPLVVGTIENNSLWEVANGRITYEGAIPGKK